MGKILEKEFRNELYKNLCEAGYSKAEATNIVSVKYASALKTDLVEKLKTQAANLEADKDELVLSTDEYANCLSELAKLKEFFGKKEKISEKSS